MSSQRLYEYDDEEAIDFNCICGICKEPLDNPRITPCEHIFCLECADNWLNRQHNNKCPTCRRRLSFKDLREVMRPFRNILDSIPVICTQCDLHGIPRGNFQDHIEKQCPKRVQRCKAADIRCPWTGPRDEMDRHLAECEFERRRAIIEPLVQENTALRNELQQIKNEREVLLTRLSSLSDDLQAARIANQTRSAQPVLRTVEIRPQPSEC